MIQLLPALIILLVLTACGKQGGEASLATAPAPAPAAAPEQPADRPCAYFYFLWGSHAEYNQDFEAALDAYEKALICDPAATYIQKKIPILLIKMGEMDQAAQWLVKGIKKDPQDKAQYLLLAHLRIQQLNREEAIRLYQEVLAQDSQDSGVLLRLGILYTQHNELDKAEEIFRNLLARNDQEYYAHLYLGRLLALRQNYEEAALQYEMALSLNWSADLVYETVDFYANQEKYAEVLRLYATILVKDVDNERANLGRIQTLMSMGEDQHALDELLQLQRRSKDPSHLDTAVSKLLLRLGRTGEAKALLEKHQKSAQAPEAAYMLALIAYQEEDYRRALGFLRGIPPKSEEYADATYLQVRILRESGQSSQAVALLLKNIGSAELRHPLFFALLSSLYQEQGKNQPAMDVLSSGLSLYPENEQILFEHALLLEKSGKPMEALQSMEKVLKLHPGHPEALNFIGYTWADQSIHLDKALNYIQQAVAIKPDNGFIRDSLGWVYYRLGQLEKARDELLTALRLEPEDSNIYEHLGDVYLALRNTKEALAAYLKALEFIDSPPKKKALQKKIEKLRGK